MIKIQHKDIENVRVFYASTDESVFPEGFAMASVEGRQLILDTIHVIPGSRGCGIGDKLIEAVVGYGRKNRTTEIIGDFLPEFKGGRDEEVARKFYKKHQISIDGEDHLHGRIR